MSHLLEEFKTFLDQSPSSWHAAAEMGNRLALHDFTPLAEEESWKLEPGKGYFVIRGGSLCAFRLPLSSPKRMRILASHTDSPALKLKPQPEIKKENMILFGLEVYGAPLLTSWLNRDLGIAGRVVTTNAKGQIEEKLVFISDAPLFIPQLALHLDRGVNENGLLLNKQDHLLPIVTLENEDPAKTGYLEILLRRYLSFHSLLSFDLFLVPLEKSRFAGIQSEMIASYRLDNLASAHACLTSLVLADSPQKETLQLAIFCDHEEIGSRSSEGAASPFLSDILKRIGFCLKMGVEEEMKLKSQALCLSVDVAHAFNPNYSNKYDANHQVLLGKGIVLKYNSDYKYASHATTAAPIIRLCQQLNLPYQSFVSRSDIPSGSTIGPILAGGLGIPTVDLGCAVFSMHSIREVLACQDYIDLCHLLTAALQEEGA